MSSASSSASSSPSMSLADMAEQLGRNQKLVQATLKAAEKRVVEENFDKLLLKYLWKIYYDAEDALKDYEEWRSSPSSTGSCVVCRKRKRSEATVEQSSISRNPCSPCIEQAISQVLDEFRNWSHDLKALRLPQDNRTPKLQERQPAGSLSSVRDIYDMKEDLQEIVEDVLSPSRCRKKLDKNSADVENKNLIIYPVIGAGGIGKTTLVQHVFNDKRITKDYFGKKAWVSCVSKEQNPLQLLNSVLQCIVKKSVCDLTQMSAIEHRMGQIFEGAKEKDAERQRLLLVLDDACATDERFWESFWIPIASSVGKGSVAIVTTKNYDAIQSMPPSLPRIGNYYLYRLGFGDCWTIFTKGMGLKTPDDTTKWERDNEELAKIGRQIVSKYQGFPKPIKTAASALRGTRDCNAWVEQLKMASRDSYLLTSFRMLQPHVKSCLRYCSLFPQDYTFDRDYLIRLCTAEGFLVEDESGRTGVRCFSDLLHSYFMEHVQNCSHIYEMPIVVHDLLRDPDVSITADFFHRKDDDDGNDSQVSPSQFLRHVSFVGREEEISLQSHRPEALQHLRSFLVLRRKDYEGYMKVSHDLDFQCMGHLRTLELSYTDIKSLPDSIGYLRNLRFLGLNSTLIKALPDSVGTLQHLRFLCLNGTLIQALPDSICTLQKLQALELESCMNLHEFPKGFGMLTNLQTLPVFVVGEGHDRYSGIQELARLVKLKDELTVLGLHNVSNEESGCRYLDKMQFLRGLKLCWFLSPLGVPEYRVSRSVSEYRYLSSRHCRTAMEKEEQLIKRLMPHTNLENLMIQSYSGSTLPEWISCNSYSKLKSIYLKDCLNCEFLPSLGRLPRLKRLTINCPSVKQIDDGFCGEHPSFRSLEELTFSGMWNLKAWTGVTEVDFKNLKTLEFDNCPRFDGKLPHITSLVTLSLMRCLGPIQLHSQPNLKNLWVEDCHEFKVEDPMKLSDLDSLLVANCRREIVLPEEVKGSCCSFFEDEYTLSFVKAEEN